MRIRNVVVLSDTHFGSKLALCPPKVKLDEGGYYKASNLQLKIYKHYINCLYDFIPSVIGKEKFIVVHNGDIIDGDHHNTSTIITRNLRDQENIAVEVLSEFYKIRGFSGFYFIRGTSAHSGEAAECEERIAQRLNAIPDSNGNYTRYELWLKFGSRGILAHFSHHVSTTNSSAYESTAPYKEMIEAYVEAGRWKLQPPDVIIRSHRHRHFNITIDSYNQNAMMIVTPAWQLKTPYVYRSLLGRSSLAQIGLIIIREGSEVPVYERKNIIYVERPKEEVI